MAGNGASIGEGGVQVTAAHKLDISAGGALTVGGALQSAGAVELGSSGGAITLNRNVRAASLSARAGDFTQDAASAVDGGAGAITITSSTGNVVASNLLGSGAVNLSATQGAVTVGATMSGASGQRLASLQASALNDVRINGALVAGAATLASTAGRVDTRGATLDAGGAVTLSGAAGVSTAAIVTPAAVAVDGGSGAVSLGAVAGAAGTVDANTARAAGLVVRSTGDVTLGGAALGSGGLLVEGATAGQRAGALDFGAASVFSGGDVKASAASITLGAAGIQGGAALTLDAAGALTTGAGKLESAGAASLVAGNGVSIGEGGVQVTAAHKLGISAGGALTVGGALQSAGAVELGSSGGAITLNRNVRAASLSASARGDFTQDAASAVDGGAGAITITSSTGNVVASNLLGSGAVNLSASQGAVTVGATMSGASGQRLASLQASALNDVRINGALVAGAATLASTAGRVDTRGATLDAGGAVTLSGAAGVSTAAIVTPAAVAVDGGSGAVSLGAVAGAAGTVDANTARAAGLVVRSTGDVTLGGAALGSGGLLVEGATAGQRAGALDFGAASVFSGGDVKASAASITLGAAGIQGGAALTLDAAGALATGAGKLESAGAASLVAGNGASIGEGGVQVTAAHKLGISAGGALTVGGALQSAGAVELGSSGGAITLNRNVRAASLSASARGDFTQDAASAVDGGAGAITITSSTGNVVASNLLGSGAVNLSATQGAVTVGATMSGASGQRLASLQASALNDVRINGALVAGAATLASTAGRVDTRGATLDAGGAVTLSGAAGVSTAAIVTPAAVAVDGGSGAVSLGAVAGAAGTVDANTARAAGLVVRSTGDVTLGGAALGSGGLLVEGSTAGQRAGALDFGAASVFSGGDVKASAASITLGAAGIASSAGAVRLDASGALASGSRQISAATTATLLAGSTLTLGSGGLLAGGDVTLRSSGDLAASGPIKTLGGLSKLSSTSGSVRLDEVFTWETGVASSGALEVAAALDVLLAKPLGGPNTGYLLLADRYQPNLRPLVGSLDITAGRDVELNGLNLDGSASGLGLSVTAGRNLVSNELIAVNKGDIRLLSRSVAADEGIYLGNAVYSRGLDTASGKLAYNVTIGGTGLEGTRGNLFLFDNTAEVAFVPNLLGFQVIGQRALAKIIVANNVANYKQQGVAGLEADPTLVDASNGAAVAVTLGADGLYGVAFTPNSRVGALSAKTLPDDLAAFRIFNGSLSSATNRNPGTGLGQGIALKVQSFVRPGDQATEAQAVDGTALNGICNFGATYLQCGFDSVEGLAWSLDDDGQPQSEFYSAGFQSPSTLPAVGAQGTVGYKFKIGASDFSGTSNGFVNKLPPGTRSSSLTTQISNDEPQFDDNTQTYQLSNTGTVGYFVSGRLVQVDTGTGSRVTRVLIGDAVMRTATEDAQFNAQGGLNGGTGNSNSGSGTNMGAAGNSNQGFTAIGSFGGQSAGSVGSIASNASSTGTSFGTTGAGSAVAAPANGAAAAVNFGAQAASNASAGGSNGSTSAAAFGVQPAGAAGASTGNAFALPAAGGRPREPAADGPGLVLRPVDLTLPEVVIVGDESVLLGGRPAGQADFGRGGASAGFAGNVFGRRFPLLRVLDGSVCGDGKDLQPTAGANRRDCVAARR